jgi:hypothetical protein
MTCPSSQGMNMYPPTPRSKTRPASVNREVLSESRSRAEQAPQVSRWHRSWYFLTCMYGRMDVNGTKPGRGPNSSTHDTDESLDARELFQIHFPVLHYHQIDPIWIGPSQISRHQHCQSFTAPCPYSQLALLLGISMSLI